jgi:hypothetical protein
MSDVNVGELLSTTLQTQSDSIADAISDNVAFYYLLRKKGKITKESGGADLRTPIMHSENTTFGWYHGWEELDVTPQNVLDVAKYSWKQASVAVVMSGLEERVNGDSKTRLLNLLAARVDNAKKSAINGVEASLFSDGTGDSGKELTGLKAHVSTSPGSGTHGGIDRATWSFWQNRADTYTSLDASNVKSVFNEQFTALTRGQDRVGAVLVGDDGFNALMEATQAIQSFTGKSELADVGFNAMKFRGAEIIHCGGIGGAIPAGYIYFLNLDTFEFKVHTKANWTPAPGGDRIPTKQDGIVKPLLFMGNLCMNNAKLNGVLTQA